MQHKTYIMEIRIIEEVPMEEITDDYGLEDNKSIRRYVSLNVTGCRLPTNKGMQSIAYQAKQEMAKQTYKRR